MAFSFNQNKLWKNWRILNHVSDAYVACVGLFGHLFWNKRSFWQQCHLISCHIRKLSAHDRWPMLKGNPAHDALGVVYFYLKNCKFQCLLNVFSWPWSYGSWIYNSLCNQCMSPLSLSPAEARCTGYNTDKVCQWLVTGQWFPPWIKLTATI
jgi:hypothetical protein